MECRLKMSLHRAFGSDEGKQHRGAEAKGRSFPFTLCMLDHTVSSFLRIKKGVDRLEHVQ